MTVKNIGSEASDINPFDFYAVDSEGNHYEYGDGNAFMAIDGKELNAATLNKGEKVTGRIRRSRGEWAPLLWAKAGCGAVQSHPRGAAGGGSVTPKPATASRSSTGPGASRSAMRAALSTSSSASRAAYASMPVTRAR
jgi:hypothetical protein